MNNLEIINFLKTSTFEDEDGDQYQLEFEEGLSAIQLEKLAASFPNQTIDAELLEILKITKGWSGYGIEQLAFDAVGTFGFSELIPYNIALGHDGFGNYWVLEIESNGQLGKVYFVCHDPAVLVIHSQTLNEFLNQTIEFYKNPSESYIDDIVEKHTYQIWKSNPNTLSKASFLNQNPTFESFIGQFEGEEWTVADLRNGNNTDGFAWGKFGSNAFTKRHDTERIWVLKNKKKSLFKRLFK